jgi:predicted ATPase
VVLRAQLGARAHGSELSVAIGRFIGRESLLEALEGRLAAGARLISLTGPPGSGKTRLAERLAERAAEGAAGGRAVVLVELSDTADVAALPARVAAALGPGVDARELSAALAARGRLLLVLDNLEQLLPAASPLVWQWCRRAPRLAVVVTSRERLEVDGEEVVEVGPLELPASGTSTLAVARQSEAVRLLEARMEAARGRGLVDDGEAAAAVALVEALDGLPLAIELAASRTRGLSLRELHARLDQRFQLLARRPRGLHDRHATLQAALESSWQALADDEQRTLAWCAVFAGTFSLALAEVVLDTPRTAELLTALVDRSLVVAEATPGTPDHTRYRLLLSIRALARQRLVERGEEAQARARHRAAYVAALGPELERLERTGERAARRWIAREAENLRLVAGDPEVDAALQADVVRALEKVSLGDDPALRVARLDRALAGPPLDPVRAAHVLLARGRIHAISGQAEQAVADFERAHALALGAGVPGLAAAALVQLSVRRRQRAELEEARVLGEQALALAGGAGFPQIEAEAWACMGLLYGELDRPREARVADERALAMFRELGDVGSQGLALGNLAELALGEGALDEAERLYTQAIEAFRANDDVAYEGVYLGFAAGVAHARGQRGRARALYAEALERLDRVAARHVRGLTSAAMGALAADDDQVDEAAQCFAEAELSGPTRAVPAYVAAIEVYRGLLELAHARRQEALGHGEAAAAHHRAALARRRDVQHADISASVRAAVRLLDAGLAARAVTRTVRAARDAAWVELGADRLDLSRRTAPRLILLALLEAHARGQACPQEVLVAAGWPGERVLPEAASTRLRVAIATLRRLGLGALIVTHDGSYALDQAVRVERV